MSKLKNLSVLVITMMMYTRAVSARGIDASLKGSDAVLSQIETLDTSSRRSDWNSMELTLAMGPSPSIPSGEGFGVGRTGGSGDAMGVGVETFSLRIHGEESNAVLVHGAGVGKVASGPVLRASVAMEIASWVGMLVFLPDANDYKREWLDPKPERWAREFKVEYTNNNNGILVDYVFHPMLGATMYGYSRSAGANYFSAFLIAGAHNALWELKELPHAGSFAAQDFVTTFAASGITAIGDMLGDTILDNNPSVPLRGLAYLLKAPSAFGNLLYFVSLGIQERRSAA